MKIFNMISTLGIAAIAAGFIGSVQAGSQIPTAQAIPKLKVAANHIVNPPQCAEGFTPINIKLVEHEGEKWYQYDCVQQKVIKRSCNADTEVTNVKNKFIDMPSDGKSNNSKLNLSYTCFNYIPVK